MKTNEQNQPSHFANVHELRFPRPKSTLSAWSLISSPGQVKRWGASCYSYSTKVQCGPACLPVSLFAYSLFRVPKCLISCCGQKMFYLSCHFLAFFSLKKCYGYGYKLQIRARVVRVRIQNPSILCGGLHCMSCHLISLSLSLY